VIRQCKDIPNEVFLLAVDLVRYRDARIVTRWDIQNELSWIYNQEIPDKLVLAKAKKLINQKKMDGCYCGCRGDFTTLRWN